MSDESWELSRGAAGDLLRGMKVGEQARIEDVLSLDANPLQSTKASYVVEAATTAGNRVRLLVKGGIRGELNRDGRPWGVDYEVRAYAGVLGQLRSYDSPYLGDVEDGSLRWLVLRYVEAAQRVNRSKDPLAMARVASWLGAFQREAQEKHRELNLQVLNAYGDGTVLTYAELAAANLSEEGRGDSESIAMLRELGPLAQEILRSEATLVHGEFFPHNVLLSRGSVVPIDWEWAGVASGELDLASLLAKWPDETAKACVSAYRDQRALVESERDFSRRYNAGRFYFAVRMLASWRKRHRDQRLYSLTELQESGRLLMAE